MDHCAKVIRCDASVFYISNCIHSADTFIRKTEDQKCTAGTERRTSYLVSDSRGSSASVSALKSKGSASWRSSMQSLSGRPPVRVYLASAKPNSETARVTTSANNLKVTLGDRDYGISTHACWCWGRRCRSRCRFPSFQRGCSYSELRGLPSGYRSALSTPTTHTHTQRSRMMY